MKYDQYSGETRIVARLRQNSAYAARRMLIWMIFVLAFTVVTSVIAMFEFVNSGTANPIVSPAFWAFDQARFISNTYNPVYLGWK